MKGLYYGPDESAYTGSISSWPTRNIDSSSFDMLLGGPWHL